MKIKIFYNDNSFEIVQVASADDARRIYNNYVKAFGAQVAGYTEVKSSTAETKNK